MPPGIQAGEAMKFSEMNLVNAPGFGDPETWNGRRPYVDYDEWWDRQRETRLEYDDYMMSREPWDFDRMTLDETIDNLEEEEYPREQ